MSLKDEIRELKKQLNQLSDYDNNSFYEPRSPIRGSPQQFSRRPQSPSSRFAPSSSTFEEIAKLKSQLREAENVRLAQEREIIGLRSRQYEGSSKNEEVVIQMEKELRLLRYKLKVTNLVIPGKR